jgi:membrane-associated phospholipid phosphatase
MTEKAASVLGYSARRSFAVLVAAALFVAVSVSFLDRPLALFMQRQPQDLRAVFEWINQLGKSDWYLWPSGFLAIAAALQARRAAGRNAARLWRWLSSAAAYLFVAVAVPGILVNIVKFLVGRTRPKLFYGQDIYGLWPFSGGSDFHSFPSGHSQTAFCIAFALATLWPAARWPLAAAAVLAASARLVLGAHFLSDVVASAALAFVMVGWLESYCRERGLVFARRRHAPPSLAAEGRWWRRRLRKTLSI